jgi:hypothetical protein
MALGTHSGLWKTSFGGEFPVGWPAAVVVTDGVSETTSHVDGCCRLLILLRVENGH